MGLAEVPTPLMFDRANGLFSHLLMEVLLKKMMCSVTYLVVCRNKKRSIIDVIIDGDIVD